MEYIKTNHAPKSIGPYSQAIISNNLLFTSGQLPICPKSNKIESQDIEQQTKQVLKNLEHILFSAKSNVSKVIKINIYLTSLESFSTVNDVYAKFFDSHKPARTTIEVSKLPQNALIEMDCIAKI